MPKLVGMNHIALEVGDIDEALAFWESIFGELELRGRSGGMAFIDMGDQFIALARGRTQPPDRQRHFGLVVDDKEAVRERLKELGVPVSPGRSLDFTIPRATSYRSSTTATSSSRRRTRSCAAWASTAWRNRTAPARSYARKASPTNPSENSSFAEQRLRLREEVRHRLHLVLRPEDELLRALGHLQQQIHARVA